MIRVNVKEHRAGLCACSDKGDRGKAPDGAQVPGRGWGVGLKLAGVFQGFQGLWFGWHQSNAGWNGRMSGP